MRTRRLQGVTRATRRACAFVVAAGLLASGCGRATGSGAGSADASGGNSSDGSGTGSVCVDVSHVDPRQKDNLDVIGSGFEAYEGRWIRVVVTHGEPTYGLGEAPILGGSFEIQLPGVLGDYTGIGIYVDTVRDHACSPGEEILWQVTTGPASARGPVFTLSAPDAAVWEVTPSTLRTFEQAGPCNINGIFDLTNPLRCPARN
jgi:hypothetical protein